MTQRWDGEIEWDVSIPPAERPALEQAARDGVSEQVARMHGATISRVRISGRRLRGGGWELTTHF